ncbi:hypothetical protein Tco_0559248 [Tanacetum coccineum]
MRVNILEFDKDTLNPEGLINWLVAVEEVFEFKEVPQNVRVSLIATKLHGGGNLICFPNKTRPGGGSALKCFKCGELGHRQSLFDDDKYKEEVMTEDVGVNLMVRRSCLTPRAKGWEKNFVCRA